MGIVTHEKACKCNPNRVERDYSIFRTEDFRNKMSIALKKAHKEGRASTWKSRENCNRSYPEKWFMNVIQDNFDDKNYVTELPVGKWFLDFAWKEKMLYIEIDGQQHKRYVDRQELDKEKDDFCKSLGWKCLRLSWEYISNNKNEAIEIAKDFIDSGELKEIKWESKLEKVLERNKRCEEQGKIDSKGRHYETMLSESDWVNRKNLILGSNVDLTKFGWVLNVIKATGLSKKEIYNTVKHFNMDVYKLDRAKY